MLSPPVSSDDYAARRPHPRVPFRAVGHSVGGVVPARGSVRGRFVQNDAERCWRVALEVAEASRPVPSVGRHCEGSSGQDRAWLTQIDIVAVACSTRCTT
jgi:hypothetical protein